MKRFAATALTCLMLATAMLPAPAWAGSATAPVPADSLPVPTSPLPLLAFYYLWFDPASWSRAKIDYPELGRYSSDDPRVLRQHVQWAKSAGIDGFIVGWKDTDLNDRRLRLLMEIARVEDFKLAIIYQSLDFNRQPLPVARVAADFKTFRDTFSQDPVFFRIGGKPLTIWSGTWAYTHDDIAAVTSPVRPDLQVLNTQKNVHDYEAIADVTDGDAYYWSSVNPDTNTNHDGKLADMARAVHATGKYWIAPFAPGFDARLVGGKSVVGRNNGQTLRTEYATALRSSPDALGLISWNEFSENTYVEPSRNYGDFYLSVLRDLRQVPVPTPTLGMDSSADGPPFGSRTLYGNVIRYWPAMLIVGFPVLLVVGLSVATRRQRRRISGRMPRPIPTPRPGSRHGTATHAVAGGEARTTRFHEPPA
jgi:hypothetical protein